MTRRAPARRTGIARFLYDLRYRAGEYALRGFVAILPFVPVGWLTQFTDFLARLSFRLLWKYRSRMESNVALALGNDMADAAERKALVWRAWRNFAHGVVDTGIAMHLPKEQLRVRIAIEGEEHLKRALAAGRGVIALSAHLGSFTLIGPRLAAAGYAFSVVVKQPGNQRFARVIDDYRARGGLATISAKPRSEAVRGILKALRANRIVLVVADEFKSGGVMVNFLGQNAPAPRGPATLALRTGAITLPMFATRQPDGSVKISIGPELVPVRKDDLEESVVATTARFTRCLEAAVRRWPDQWNWLGFHRSVTKAIALHRTVSGRVRSKRRLLNARRARVRPRADIPG